MNKEQNLSKSQREVPVEPVSKSVKHALETEEIKNKAVNYSGVGRTLGQSQHTQDTKRRRTDEVEEKEIISSKPMRVSVVKQVSLSKSL